MPVLPRWEKKNRLHNNLILCNFVSRLLSSLVFFLLHPPHTHTHLPVSTLPLAAFRLYSSNSSLISHLRNEHGALKCTLMLFNTETWKIRGEKVTFAFAFFFTLTLTLASTSCAAFVKTGTFSCDKQLESFCYF